MSSESYEIGKEPWERKATRLPFWSDDFDMDLLKVIPETVEILGDMADRTFWTVGHTTHGRLNSPAIWNTHGAFLWRVVPTFTRDKNGWFNILGCVSDDPLIECTWLEWLRDQWSHHFSFMLLPDQAMFHSPDWNAFERLMWHRRGWREDGQIDEAYAAARNWLEHINYVMRGAVR